MQQLGDSRIRSAEIINATPELTVEGIAAFVAASRAAFAALANGVSGEPIHCICSTAAGSVGYQMSVTWDCVFAPRQS